MPNNIPQTTYHPKNNYRHLNNTHGYISPRKIQQFHDRISRAKNIGVQRPARARTSLSAFQEGRELISASAINAEELRERLGMQNTTASYQQSKAAFYLHVYGFLGGILPAANQIPVRSVAEAYRERSTPHFPTPRVTRHAGPASPTADKNQPSNNNQGEKTVSVSLASNRAEHAKTDADPLSAGLGKLRKTRAVSTTQIKNQSIEKQVVPYISGQSNPDTQQVPAALIPSSHYEARPPGPRWVERMEENNLLRGLYHYMHGDLGRWAEDMDSGEEQMVLYSNLAVSDADASWPDTKNFMPADVTLFDEGERNRLMRPLMRSLGFYPGTSEKPIDAAFQQKILAKLLRTLNDLPGSEDSYSIADYSFLRAAQQGLTVAEVINNFVYNIQTHNPRVDKTVAQWVANNILKFFEPALVRTDTPGSLIYGGYPMAELQIDIDTARELGLDPDNYSREVLRNLGRSVQMLAKNDAERIDTTASQIRGALWFAAAQGDIDLAELKTNTTATIVTALRSLEDARHHAYQTEYGQWLVAINTINLAATTRNAIGFKMLLDRGIPPGRSFTLWHSEFDESGCDTTKTVLEFLLSDCTQALKAMRYPNMPTPADLEAAFNQAFAERTDDVITEWEKIVSTSIDDVIPDINRATKLEIIKPEHVYKRIHSDLPGPGISPGVGLATAQHLADELKPVAYPTEKGGSIIKMTTRASDLTDVATFYHLSFDQLGKTLLQLIGTGENTLQEWIERDPSHYFSNGTLQQMEEWPKDNVEVHWRFNAIESMSLTMPNDKQALSTRLAEELTKQILMHDRVIAYGLTDIQSERESTMDFEKSLIPLYDCVRDIQSGALSKAILPCMSDFLTFLPLAGSLVKAGAKTAQIGMRLSESAIVELADMVGEKLSFNSGLSVAGRVMPPWMPGKIAQEFKLAGAEIATNAIEAIDPGIGLLQQIGAGVLRLNIGLLNRLANALRRQPEMTVIAKDIKQNIIKGFSRTPHTDIPYIQDYAIIPGRNGERYSSFAGRMVKPIVGTDGRLSVRNALVTYAPPQLGLDKSYLYSIDPLTGNPFGRLLKAHPNGRLSPVGPLPDVMHMSAFSNRMGSGIEIALPLHVQVEHLADYGYTEQGTVVFELDGRLYGVHKDTAILRPLEDIERDERHVGLCRIERAAGAMVCSVTKVAQGEYVLGTGKKIFQAWPGSNAIHVVDSAVIVSTRELTFVQKQKKNELLVTRDYTYLDGRYIYIDQRGSNLLSINFSKDMVPANPIILPAEIDGTMRKLEDKMVVEIPFDGYRRTVTFGTYEKYDEVFGMLYIDGDTYYRFKISDDLGENTKIVLTKATNPQIGHYTRYQYEQGNPLHSSDSEIAAAPFKVDLSRTYVKNMIQIFYETKTTDGDAILDALKDIHSEEVLLNIFNKLEKYVKGEKEWDELDGLDGYASIKNTIDDMLTGVMGLEDRTGIFNRQLGDSFVNKKPSLREVSHIQISADSAGLKEALENFQTMFPGLPSIEITEAMTSGEILMKIRSTFTDTYGRKNLAYGTVKFVGNDEKKYISCASGGGGGIEILEDAAHLDGIKEYKKIPGNALNEDSRIETEDTQRAVDAVDLPNNTAKGKTVGRALDTEAVLLKVISHLYPPGGSGPAIESIEIVTFLRPCTSCLCNVILASKRYPDAEISVKYFPETQATLEKMIKTEPASAQSVLYKPRRNVKRPVWSR